MHEDAWRHCTLVFLNWWTDYSETNCPITGNGWTPPLVQHAFFQSWSLVCLDILSEDWIYEMIMTVTLSGDKWSHTNFSLFRTDYEGFVRDLTKQFVQHHPLRLDTYMASTIQVPDWKTFIFNTIFFSFFGCYAKWLVNLVFFLSLIVVGLITMVWKPYDFMGVIFAIQMVTPPFSSFHNTGTQMTWLTFLIRQAFDAPWLIIQANAIYFSSCTLSLSDDHHILNQYYALVSFRHECYLFISWPIITKSNMVYSQKFMSKSRYSKR